MFVWPHREFACYAIWKDYINEWEMIPLEMDSKIQLLPNPIPDIE